MLNSNILYITNVDWFFLSHWKGSAKYAQTHLGNITVASEDTGCSSQIEADGFLFFKLPRVRGGGFVSSMILAWSILRAILFVKPKLVHLVTVKPLIIGGLILRFFPNLKVVSYVSGLGYLFTKDSIKHEVARIIVRPLYRLALGHNQQTVIFENHDDQSIICKYADIPITRTVIVNGSGVDIDLYCPPVIEPNPLVVMMAARLLRDKGVFEFLHAAERLATIYRESDICVKFVIVGSIDIDNPASLDLEEISFWKSRNFVEFWGHMSNMHDVLKLSSVVVLPSYREGFPRVLMEAAACGRPVVATNVPGCRDTVVAGYSGLLVPAQDVISLASAINKLVSDSAARIKFGSNARQHALNNFDIKFTAKRILDVYTNLLA